MWPAVPRIMRASRLPPLVFPQLERAQRPAIGEMLSEELAQQPLVRARVGVLEGDAHVAVEEGAQRIARLRRKHASCGGEAPATGTERTARHMAEHHARLAFERRVTPGAVVDGGCEAELRDD